MARITAAVALVATTFLLTACGKDEPKAEPKMDMPMAASAESVSLAPGDMKWTAGPPSLPAGAQMAALEGSPSKAGPFTVRFKLPAGYKIPPHTHPGDEHITVLEGDFSLGMGSAWSDKDLKSFPVGSFAVMPKGMQHFATTTGGATLQLNGIGPWDIKYVNPSDDPRKR
jgi:quercetin dioxygenase-like cupin family protein